MPRSRSYRVSLGTNRGVVLCMALRPLDVPRSSASTRSGKLRSPRALSVPHEAARDGHQSEEYLPSGRSLGAQDIRHPPAPARTFRPRDTVRRRAASAGVVLAPLLPAGRAGPARLQTDNASGRAAQAAGSPVEHRAPQSRRYPTGRRAPDRTGLPILGRPAHMSRLIAQTGTSAVSGCLATGYSRKAGMTSSMYD
jgi:hypothetical protein